MSKHENADKAFVVKMQRPLFTSNGYEHEGIVMSCPILIYDSTRKIQDQMEVPSKEWLDRVFGDELRIFAWVYIDDEGILVLPTDDSQNTDEAVYDDINFDNYIHVDEIFEDIQE